MIYCDKKRSRFRGRRQSIFSDEDNSKTFETLYEFLVWNEGPSEDERVANMKWTLDAVRRRRTTIWDRKMGIGLVADLEDLKNRIMAEGRDDDASLLRVAIFRMKHLLKVHPNPIYEIARPIGGWRRPDSFSAEEKHRLRPIAETLAMLDGNAFFGTLDENGDDIYWHGYLGQADAVFESNGGVEGWAGLCEIGKRSLATD